MFIYFFFSYYLMNIQFYSPLKLSFLVLNPFDLFINCIKSIKNSIFKIACLIINFLKPFYYLLKCIFDIFIYYEIFDLKIRLN